MLLVTVVPAVCMEGNSLITFKCNPSFIAVKQSNLPLIKTLHAHYQEHKKTATMQGFVPVFPHVSSYAVSIVNSALDVVPDRFGEYYNKLSAPNRTLLIKVSGQYDDDRNKTMLNIPELTKRLIEVYFTDRTLRTHIKSYFKDEDEDCVRNYFRAKLIYNKSLFGAWAPKSSITDGSNTRMLLTNNIYLGSLFLNGYHSNNQFGCTVPLRISDTVHQTYGSCFITNTHECRVTDVRDKHCVLWVVNHNDPSLHKSTCVKHKGEIKGCCLSKKEAGVGYAVTYSEHDMVFSTITMQKNGQPVIKSVHVDIPNKGTIVDVCFHHGADQLLVATYEGLNSVLRCWAMDGKALKESYFPFKDCAFLEKIFLSRTATNDVLVLLFGVADQLTVYKCASADNGQFAFDSLSDFDKCTGHFRVGNFWEYTNGISILKRGDSFFMYDDLSCSPFDVRVAVSEEKSKQSSGFFGDLMNAFTSQPDSECYRVYSPDGQFVLCNSLKNKLGVFWVETLLKDAVTHKPILSIDTLYRNFAGVGFTHDGTELIFLNHQYHHETVSLLNDKDKKYLQGLEDIAFQNVGVTSLLKRLCMKCKENGVVTLRADSPAYHMLYDWTHKSSILREDLCELLATCMPLSVKKVGVQKK